MARNFMTLDDSCEKTARKDEFDNDAVADPQIEIRRLKALKAIADSPLYVDWLSFSGGSVGER